MAQPDDAVYPHSEPTGKAIPFDVGEPTGLYITAFVAAASAERTLSAAWEIVVLYATEDCVIGFGSGVTLTLAQDVVKANHQFVPKQTPVSVKLPSNLFKVIRVSADGILYVQNYRRWQALSTELLQARIE